MNIEGIVQAGKKAFELVSKESGTIDSLGKSIKNALPRGAESFDRFVARGANDKGEKILIDMLSFRSSEGKVLKRVVNRTEGADTFFKTSNYQYTGENSHFIHTNEFKNKQLISSRQEIMNVHPDLCFDNKIVVRTGVEKANISGKASSDTHFCGEFFTMGKKSRKLQFSFQRDAKGYISSPLSFEKAAEGVNLNDPYLVTYLNPNKAEVARDFVKINLEEQGFSEMPKVITFRKGPDKNKKTLEGYCSVLEMKGFLSAIRDEKEIEPPTFIFPKIGMNTANTKSGMANTAAHEVGHLNRFRSVFDKEDVESMEEPIKSYWKNEVGKVPTPSTEEMYKFGRALGRYVVYDECEKSGLISHEQYFRRYLRNPIEKEARDIGERAQKHYDHNFDAFNHIFTVDWNRFWSEIKPF